jgi:hypothetical protein
VNGFDHLEALAEQLVEGTFERLFRPRLHPSEVARRLARAMDDGRVADDSGQVLLPNRYWVFLNPDDFAILKADGDQLRSELLRYLQRLATESGARFSGLLRVALHPVADLVAGQLDVRAAHGGDSGSIDDTQGVAVVTQTASEAGRWSLRLGEHFLPLGEPVIRLGRALDNDLILDDRRVSRRHAQLRWREGTYRLSDMGSSGGTIINGRPLRKNEEAPLAANDVISLAGVKLIVHTDTGRPATDVPPTALMPSSEA